MTQLSDADLLEKAVELIDSTGHTKGRYQEDNPDGSVSYCLVGAAIEVATQHHNQTHPVFQNYCRDCYLAQDEETTNARMHQALGFKPWCEDDSLESSSTVYNFNDANDWSAVRDFALSRAKDLRNEGK